MFYLCLNQLNVNRLYLILVLIFSFLCRRLLCCILRLKLIIAFNVDVLINLLEIIWICLNIDIFLFYPKTWS